MSRSRSAPPDNRVRATVRLAFARAATGDPGVRIEPASGDASARSYWRVSGARGGAILMDAPPGSGDLAAWLDVGQRLRDVGLNAPEVLAADQARGFLLLSDLGTSPYLACLDSANADALYGDALAALRAMQTRIDPAGLPPFDGAFVLRELELMPTWFLERHLGAPPTPTERTVLDAAFAVLAAAVVEQPCVFMHRDFHSRNLMYVAAHNPGIIDFQDAVVGPVTYDVVSLLRDCYVAWDDRRVRDWSEAYRARLARLSGRPIAIGAARWRRWFDLTGLQRHLKVLGIFCRLWYRDGKRGYLADLPRVWSYVRTVAVTYPEMSALLALLQQHVGRRDLTVVAPCGR